MAKTIRRKKGSYKQARKKSPQTSGFGANLKDFGILACFNQSGVGYDAKEITTHLDIQEVGVLPNMHKGMRYDWVKDRNCFLFSPPMLPKEEIIEWLDGIKIKGLITIEHPYSWDLLSECKKRGIKTFNIVNWEAVDRRKALLEYDWFICKVPYAQKYLKEVLGIKNLIYLPYPLATERFTYRRREGKPKVFLHISGYGGRWDRKNTELTMKAFASSKVQGRLIVLSQVDWKVERGKLVKDNQLKRLLEDLNDSRIELRIANDTNENYELYPDEVDVSIQPSRVEGYGLNIVEPMMCGIPCICTDIEPINGFMFNPYLVKPESIEIIDVHDVGLPYANVNQKALQRKIEEIAGRDITKDSEKAREVTEAMSWEAIGNKWVEGLQERVDG